MSDLRVPSRYRPVAHATWEFLSTDPTFVPTKHPAPYNLSFTAASLRPELSRIIAEEFLITSDWETTKRRILATNALQARSVASGVRLERELRQRLQTLTHEQLNLLAHSVADDRAAMCWLASIKYNGFAFEFTSEILRDKLASQDIVLRPSDYEGFIHAKAASHPELTALKESSRTKVRRVLLRMLNEAGLLRKSKALGAVQRPVLSPSALDLIRRDNRHWLAGFLLPDSEIARL